MYIGLRFLLTYGSFINIPFNVNEAREVIDKWASGWYKLKGHDFLTGCDPVAGVRYAIRISEIIAIHTIDLNQQQPQNPGPSPQQLTQKWIPNASGTN
jgi:hypothetical protein